MNCQMTKTGLNDYRIEGEDPLSLVVLSAAFIIATLRNREIGAEVAQVLEETLGAGHLFHAYLLSQAEFVYAYVDSWVEGKLKNKPLPLQDRQLIALALSEMAKQPRTFSRTPCLGWDHLNEQFIALNSDGTPYKYAPA